MAHSSPSLASGLNQLALARPVFAQYNSSTMDYSDLIDDLKQFITLSISQATSTLATKEDIGRLEQKIDSLQDAVSDAITTSNDATHEQLDNHEHRLVKLERRLA